MVNDGLLAAVDRVTGIACAPPAGSKALEFGCGHGRWLNSLQSRGWITFGIEPAVKTAFTSHQELTSIPPRPAFRLVIASHVLEHLHDPGLQISRLGRATLPGGWIYVSVPNLDALPEHRDWHYVLNGKTHLAAFTLPCLTYLLERGGFAGVTMVPFVRRGSSDRGKTMLRVVARRVSNAMPTSSAGQRPADAAVACLRRAGLLDATGDRHDAQQGPSGLAGR